MQELLLSSFSLIKEDPIGQQIYLTAGTFEFRVPSRVYNISAVAIGGGGGGEGNRATRNGFGGGGGGLCYSPGFEVYPGQILTIIVGRGGSRGTENMLGGDGGDSIIRIPEGILLRAGGGTGGRTGLRYGGTFDSELIDVFGGNGGDGNQGGGGAGGYNGNGGKGGSRLVNPNRNDPGENGSGGGAGGGRGTSTSYGARGGSTSLISMTSSGLGGGVAGNTTSNYGGEFPTSATHRGGAGGGGAGQTGNYPGGSGSIGGVRLIWGPNRAYPNTNTQDM